MQPQPGLVNQGRAGLRRSFPAARMAGREAGSTSAARVILRFSRRASMARADVG